MVAGDETPPPTRPSFAALLKAHLENGTRSPGSGRVGSAWGITEFAMEVGVSDRTVRFWRTGESLPRDLLEIEEKLFGRTDAHAKEQREELRAALARARAEAEGRSDRKPEAAAPAAVPLARAPDRPRPPPKSDRFVSIGSLFKGREGAMERLRESLAQGGRTAVTAKAQALHGMGGLGKTRLAIEYGLAHEKDYSALLFLSGETPAALEAAEALLAHMSRGHAVITMTGPSFSSAAICRSNQPRSCLQPGPVWKSFDQAPR